MTITAYLEFTPEDIPGRHENTIMDGRGQLHLCHGYWALDVLARAIHHSKNMKLKGNIILEHVNPQGDARTLETHTIDYS